MLLFARLTTACLPGPISSRANPRVKAARKLLQNRRVREREGLVFVEGTRLVLDAIDAGNSPETLFYSEEACERGEHGPSLQKMIDRLDPATTVLASEDIMDYMSDTVNGQGVAAILRRKVIPLPVAPHLTLIMDRLADPGNVGTLLRAAAGAGADSVIATTGCADVFGLKALRAGMGAQFRLPIATNMEWDLIRSYMKEKSLSAVVADGKGETVYFDYDWTVPSVLIVGSEAIGPSQEALKCANDIISIPLTEGAAESLNAAVAASVILFEAQRQRICAQKA